MKIINVEQGSQSWLSWRKTVITATDCPAILGSSPWSTAHKVWQRKLDLIEEQKPNEAMERGKRLEPKARLQFIERHGINMTPAVVESTELDFLGASLDGLSDCKRYILEVKCGGDKLYKQAAEGVIPKYYQHQIQHQLLVTGAEKAFYYCYNGMDGICIEVLPDAEFKKLFLTSAREFWKCIAFNEPPALQDSDYKDMTGHAYWKGFATQYKEINEKIKSLEDLKDSYRKELLKICGDQNCMGDGVKVVKSVIRGRVAYDDIPGIKDMDLDKYRKGSTTTWKILVS